MGRGDEEEEGRQLGRQELIRVSASSLPEAVTVAANRVEVVADRRPQITRERRRRSERRSVAPRSACARSAPIRLVAPSQQAAAAEQKAAELTAAQKAGWKARQEEAIAEAIRQRHMQCRRASDAVPSGGSGCEFVEGVSAFEPCTIHKGPPRYPTFSLSLHRIRSVPLDPPRSSLPSSRSSSSSRHRRMYGRQLLRRGPRHGDIVLAVHKEDLTRLRPIGHLP